MKFPYGISDFRQVIGKGYYFVDRSDRIRTLEKIGKQIYQRLRRATTLRSRAGSRSRQAGRGRGRCTRWTQIMAKAQPRALAKRVAKTGQTLCYDVAGGTIACAGTGQDGQYQAGIDPVVAPTCCGTTNAYNTPAWTGVRFTDNGDGTVTDNLTALIWLKNANCFGPPNWATALSDANTLANGSCGLSDGSSAGQLAVAECE